MKLKLVDELIKHPFYNRSFDDIKPRLNEIFLHIEKKAKKWDWLSKVDSKLEDSEWYRYDVFNKLTAVFSVLDRIVYAHSFLQKFPSQKNYEKNYEITQYIWIEYHFYIYMLSVVSLFDCILILTNAVFRIGLLDRACKRDAIINNYWLTQIGFDSLLKNFEKFSGKYKENRDIYLHRGKGKTVPEILNSHNLAFLKMVSFLELHSDTNFPKDIIALGFKKEIDDLLELIEKETFDIQEKLYKILTALDEQYIKRR